MDAKARTCAIVMSENLPFSNPLSEAFAALDAAKKASLAVMEVYNEEFTSQLKEDDSPITKADLQSNEIIKKILSSSNLHILSEEDDDDNIDLGKSIERDTQTKFTYIVLEQD